MGLVKATKTEDELCCECEVKSWKLGDGDVGWSTGLADWGCDNAFWGGAEGGVGESVFVAVDALWHLLVVYFVELVRTGGSWWLVLVLVEASSFWLLVLVVGGSEQLLVIGVWWLVIGSNKGCCEIGLGKSLRGCMYF